MPEEGYSNRYEIESDQVADLQKLLSEIIPANRFYTQKLEAAGVDVNVESLEAFFQVFPFTSKAELVEDQLAHPPYGTTLTYPVEKYTRFTLTSATTGSPIRWLDTPESWAWMVENKAKVYQAAGITSEDRGFFPFSFGPFLGFWIAYEAALFLKCLCFQGGGLSSLARLQMILDQEITFLCCTPTYAIRLGEVARSEGMDLASSKMRAIFVGGEPGGSAPAVYSRIEPLWPGARVYDHHGMTETGSVSYACPVRRGVAHVVG
jgi:phenylacetate-CoA ligase